MQISVMFKNIESSDSVKIHIHEKFDKLDRMLDYSAEAHIVLSVEKLRHIADVNLICDKIKIHAREESEKNLYAAIDTLVDKVRLQIKKLKEKQRRHLAGDKESIKANPALFEASDSEGKVSREA